MVSADPGIGPEHPDYAALAPIKEEILRLFGGANNLDKDFPLIVRQAIDNVLDPVKTAKTRLADLDNVEKTFVGLRMEHYFRDRIDVPKKIRDLHIAGQDIDIKNTVGDSWMIPRETYTEEGICVLMSINESKHTCSIGLIVCRDAYLGTPNHDKKRRVLKYGSDNALWMIRSAPFQKSYFHDVDMVAFRELRKVKGGNSRAREFFLTNDRKVVHRDVIEALLYDQKDPMKRLRTNSGAPDLLKRDNAIILIGTYDSDIKAAIRLGLSGLIKDYIVGVQAKTPTEVTLFRSIGIL